MLSVRLTVRTIPSPALPNLHEISVDLPAPLNPVNSLKFNTCAPPLSADLSPFPAALTRKQGGTPHWSNQSSISLRPDHCRQRLRQNPEIQSQAPVFDVLQIQLHIRFKRRILPR